MDSGARREKGREGEGSWRGERRKKRKEENGGQYVCGIGTDHLIRKVWSGCLPTRATWSPDQVISHSWVLLRLQSHSPSLLVVRRECGTSNRYTASEGLGFMRIDEAFISI